jgi:uncharacterized glyoxalase superfamily protein PhnB
MKETKIPDGYQRVMPYLIVEDAAGLLQFMKNVFGATEKYKVMRDEDKNVIMHAEVKIGDSTIMFAEATGQWKASPAGMFIYVENADETYQKALKAGATSLGEPSDQSYGRSGGVTDPFGNVWWITSVLE